MKALSKYRNVTREPHDENRPIWPWETNFVIDSLATKRTCIWFLTCPVLLSFSAYALSFGFRVILKHPSHVTCNNMFKNMGIIFNCSQKVKAHFLTCFCERFFRINFAVFSHFQSIGQNFMNGCVRQIQSTISIHEMKTFRGEGYLPMTLFLLNIL